MNDLNNVVISGRMTKAPEFIDKQTFQIAKFSVAINYNYKKEGEWKTETTYVDCTAWNGLAEIINRIGQRGAKVTVTGRLHQENWVSKEGQNRSKLSLRVDEFNKIADPPGKGVNKPVQPELETEAPAPAEGEKTTAEKAAEIF